MGLAREEEFVRKLRDPKLPSQEEVDADGSAADNPDAATPGTVYPAKYKLYT